MSLAPVLARIDADLENATQRLLELLRIPSISTDPTFDTACETAADWLVDQLRATAREIHSDILHPPSSHSLVKEQRYTMKGTLGALEEIRTPTDASRSLPSSEGT